MNLPYPDVIPDTTYDQRPQPHHGGICPACRMNTSTLWQLPDASALRHHEQHIVTLQHMLEPGRNTAGATEACRHYLEQHLPFGTDEDLTDTVDIRPLTSTEATQLDSRRHAFRKNAVCNICHAWLWLNGPAATQGEMVWMPDLAAPWIVGLNRLALRDMMSTSDTRRQAGRRALDHLLLFSRPVRRMFGTSRPADFAAALLCAPPGERSRMRERLRGLALILRPASLHIYRTEKP
ncbi:TPA: hypothetical protein JZG04_004361 [Escherichia coli]|nr:hypothetical protein [Escherichia coli]HAX4925287.1 hypothetical protein [Escherichia coli]HAX4948466.1 hypothetical protein [Escherichia coli]